MGFRLRPTLFTIENSQQAEHEGAASCREEAPPVIPDSKVGGHDLDAEEDPWRNGRGQSRESAPQPSVWPLPGPPPALASLCKGATFLTTDGRSKDGCHAHGRSCHQHLVLLDFILGEGKGRPLRLLPSRPAQEPQMLGRLQGPPASHTVLSCPWTNPWGAASPPQPYLVLPRNAGPDLAQVGGDHAGEVNKGSLAEAGRKEDEDEDLKGSEGERDPPPSNGSLSQQPPPRQEARLLTSTGP